MSSRLTKSEERSGQMLIYTSSLRYNRQLQDLCAVTLVFRLKINSEDKKERWRALGGSGRKRATELLYNSEQMGKASKASEVTLVGGGAEAFGGNLNDLIN